LLAFTSTLDGNDDNNCNDKNKPSQRAIFQSTGNRIYKCETERRAAVQEKREVTLWSKVKSRKEFWQKVPEETKDLV